LVDDDIWKPGCIHSYLQKSLKD